MRPTKKAISPVIAVALLLVVAVVAVVFFSTWFDSFRSALFAKAESETASGQSVGVVDLVGDELFFQAGTGTAVSNVKASGTDCEFSTGVFSGLHIFDLGSCLDASGDSVEVAVFTDKGIYSKKFFVKEQYQSHELMPVLLWNKSPDLSQSIPLKDVAVDLTGNIYVVGSDNKSGTLDFFDAKYDSNMNQIWNHSYDWGTDTDTGVSIALDSFGNVYVTGMYKEGGLTKCLSIKYDSSGNHIWNVTYDKENYTNVGEEVRVDSSGNVYVVGYSTNVGASFPWDAFLVKYDSSGNELWYVNYSDNGRDTIGRGLAIDNEGNIYVGATSFFNWADYNIILAKFNSNGTELWNKSFDSGYDETWVKIALDSSDNLFIASHINRSGNFEPLLIKYDSYGTELWNMTYDVGGNNAYSRKIVIDISNNIYTSGRSIGLTEDILVMKYDTDGNELWNITYDGGNDEYGYGGITRDSSGNVYVVGYMNVAGNLPYIILKYAQK
ncbi:SBBP repeat-containing protein [Candidatus Woesearchaeota archaeon]|nr:SBBP repeat-containing protein [Candidatus Woesearchaeota archaeon]USN43785.1 MAG: SBBP repeat-containing protein [Candidatus Woesearchaeota archaeon]